MSQPVSSSREIQGRIKKIYDVTLHGPNNFRKREVIIVTDEEYPQCLKFEFQQDKVNLLGGFIEGEMVKLRFNIRGTEWVNPQGEYKYFHAFVAWSINKIVGKYVQPRDDMGTNRPYYPPANEVFGPRNDSGDQFHNNPDGGFRNDSSSGFHNNPNSGFGNTQEYHGSASNNRFDGSRYHEDHDDLPF